MYYDYKQNDCFKKQKKQFAPYLAVAENGLKADMHEIITM